VLNKNFPTISPFSFFRIIFLIASAYFAQTSSVMKGGSTKTKSKKFSNFEGISSGFLKS
jgi:hypothetical protein